jgi:hypothetical protein
MPRKNAENKMATTQFIKSGKDNFSAAIGRTFIATKRGWGAS